MLMNRKVCFIFIALSLLFSLHSRGQGGVWTWMSGATVNTAPTGNYGTKGVAAATNEPPPRYQACYWTDKSGNFWLFGGFMGQVANDLWKYDVATGLWTWVNGPNVSSAPNSAGVPGTKGVPSVNNYPSARGYGANCWTDNNGDLWLYGGSGGSDDLWRYTIATNEWCWVHGNSSGIVATVPGTIGVPATTNTPGSNQEVKSAWVDSANNLWMFGGSFQGAGLSNRLWRYNIANDTWTWVNGSGTTTAGSFGTYRTEAASNQPPSRFSYTRWKDAQDNMFVFAGGDGSAVGMRSDVWRYRPSTNNWTWVAGPSATNDPGKYPPQYCKFYDNYYPASRIENQTAFSTNSCAKAFWTFGGFDPAITKVFNDLWLFEVDSFKWAFVSGSSTPNGTFSYGTMGARSATNMPPGRGGQCMWIDNKNNLWVFGGYSRNATSYVLANDLWRFEPDSACIDLSLFTGSALAPPDTNLCLGQTTNLKIGRHVKVTYTPGTYVTPNADTSNLLFAPKATTSYTVIIAGSNCRPIDTLHFTIHVSPIDTVKLSPPHPLALCVGDTARMSVNPAWIIDVTPNTDVAYQQTGGSEIRFYPNTDRSYTVIARNTLPCGTKPDTIRFTITNDGITQRIQPVTDTNLCKGDTAVYRVHTKLDAWSLVPKTEFSMSADSMEYRFFPRATTSYRFIGIQKAGCNPKDTLSFTIHRSTLHADFIISPKVTDLIEPTFQLVNTSIGAGSLAWFQDGIYIGNTPKQILTMTDTGRYCFTLAANDELNCVDTAYDCGDIIDHGIYVPSAFSPNGDGRNDFFKPIFHGLKILQISVYNRFGGRVFVSNTADYGWNGSYAGVPCDLGTYFYVIRYQILNRPPVMLKGDITLIR